MTREELNEFSKRIAQSNKTQLVVITYEIILNYLETAQQALKKEEVREYIYNLQKAQQFVNDLTSALNDAYPLSYDLRSLYLYANNCITKSIVRKEDYSLDTVKDMMLKLKESFDKVSKEDHSGAVMKNAEPVYAGLTYGRHSIHEVTEPGSTYN